MILAIPALIITALVYAISVAIVYHFNDGIGQHDSRFNIDNKRVWLYIAPVVAVTFIFLRIFRVLSLPFRSKEEKRRARLEKERRLLLEKQAFEEELDKIIYEEVER